MNFYLPSMDECVELINKSDTFYMEERVVEGQNVRMMNYRLASHSDFFPEDGKNWTELRGLTFVQQDDGSWERNILLNKFFNYGETEGWMPEDLDNKKIIRIQDKLDGSIISFVKYSNGKVRAKSKMSFESEQAQMAQELLDNDPGMQKFIEEVIKLDKVAIFELVGYRNTIVLNYNVPSKLILLQIRDNENGTYFSENQLKHIGMFHGVKIAETFELQSLETLLQRKKTDEGYEGFVVTFEDGQMAKSKLDWYLSLHGLIGPDAFRENLLVQTILENRIDDVISALVPGVKKDSIISLTEKVNNHFNHLVVEYKELRRKYFQDFSENRKEFALKHSKDRMFSGVMKSLHTSFRDVEQTAEKSVKEYILRQCNTLSAAKEYLSYPQDRLYYNI